MMMAVRAGMSAMFSGVDHEGVAADPRTISATIKADVETVCMHPYGDVDRGLSGANMAQLLSIAAATGGGRRFVIAMGGFSITADELEGSGILYAMG